MSYYRALPPAFGAISPKFATPSVATIASAAVSGVFYSVVRCLSENALWDTITALGLMICFYYGITALACVWYFRYELLDSGYNFIMKGLLPFLGGIALLFMFGKTAVDSFDPNYGSGSAAGGVGMVFIIGMGVLLLGLVCMLITARKYPAFFSGQVLQRRASIDDLKCPAWT